MSTFQLTTRDGTALAATEFGSGSAWVIIAGATGVPQRFYARFAAFLAERGVSVLTFDYRGIGASRHAPLGPFGMTTWAEQDLAAAIDHAGDRGTTTAVLGHSFGGQALGLCPNNTRVQALLGLSAQSGHWRLWDWPHKARMWTMMHIVLPGMLVARGNIPAGLFGADPLPGGVAREWARWCRGPHYIADRDGQPVRDGFKRWQGRARFYQISDDCQYGPPRAVRELAAFYANADCEIATRSPADWGVSRVGHFDFFRPAVEHGWREAADWLSAALAQPQLAQADTDSSVL